MEENAWWPLKWMYLLLFALAMALFHPEKDKEGFGPLAVAVLSIPAVILLARDVVKLESGDESTTRRTGRKATILVALLGLALGARYWCILLFR